MKQSRRHTLLRLWRFLRPHGLSLLLTALLLVLANLLTLALPLFSGWAVDAIGLKAGHVDFSGVLRSCGGMAACCLLAAALNYLVSSRLIQIGQAVSYDLRKAAFQRMTELPVQYFDTHPSGDLISRICYDVDTVNTSLSTDLLQICTSVLTVAGSFVMLLWLSPTLSVVFFVTVPLSILLTSVQMKRMHPLFRRRSRELGALNGFAEERIGRQRAIRTYGVEAADQRQFEARNDQASQAYYEADCASAALGPSVNFINNLSLAAISVFGAMLYLGGSLSFGTLSSFVLYSRKFSGPIREAADLLLTNGPMMGLPADTLDAPVIKDTNCLVCLTGLERRPEQSGSVCIRCGKCVAACPMHLAPAVARQALEQRDLARLAKLHLEDCISCGCCSYICPAQIPLVDRVRQARQALERGGFDA